MKLILVRHGRTEANERHQYLGSTDQPVTESSLSFLRKKKESGYYPDPDGYRIYTSGMQRTEDTLRAVYGSVPFEILPDFREIDFGSFECRTYEELKEDPDYQNWLRDFENTVCPGGESYRAMKERVLRALAELLQKGEDAIVFTHGGPMAALMLELFPEEKKNFYEWNPKHGEGYVLTFENGRRAWSFL